jgi:PII-like signaling protein
MTTFKCQLVSIYLNEADQWEHHPLHLEILRFLHRSGCSGGTVLRGLAGFTAGAGIVTTSLVDVGSKLPVVVHFIDKPEKVAEVMPTLRRMAGKRLITLEDVEIVPPDPTL